MGNSCWLLCVICVLVFLVSGGLVYLLVRRESKSKPQKVVVMTKRGTISRRTVAFFDVLGFKRKIAENPLDGLAAKYERVMIDTAEALNRPLLKKHGQTALFPNHPDAKPWCIKYVFSDTIILISDEEHEESCLELLVYAWRLTQLLIAADMPPRGGITFGEIYMNQAENVVLGRALTDAYELQQEQDWIGVGIHESVEGAFPRLFQSLRDPENILGEVFMRYKIPLKEGSIRELHTLNWRYNMVVKEGTRSLFARAGDKDIMKKVNHTLDYAKTVVDGKRVYARGSEVPIELRTFYVGSSLPPFKHGDDL